MIKRLLLAVTVAILIARTDAQAQQPRAEHAVPNDQMTEMSIPESLIKSRTVIHEVVVEPTAGQDGIVDLRTINALTARLFPGLVQKFSEPFDRVPCRPRTFEITAVAPLAKL